MTAMLTLLCVLAGGAVGASLRGLAEHLAPAIGLETWIMVLLINVIGSLAIGLLLVWLEFRLMRSGRSRLVSHPRAHPVRHLFEIDATLTPTELARYDRRMQFESGFLMTGLLGGLTTFSTFALDAVTLIRADAYLSGMGVIIGTTGLSIMAAALGLALGLRTIRRGRRFCDP